MFKVIKINHNSTNNFRVILFCNKTLLYIPFIYGYIIVDAGHPATNKNQIFPNHKIYHPTAQTRLSLLC